MKTVKVTITKNGEKRIELDGFHGSGCGDIVDRFGSFGGSACLEKTAKPEFYEAEESEQERQSL